MKFINLFLLIVLVYLSWLPTINAKDMYLHELIKKANNEAIYQERYWHLLLHYNKTISGWESEVDSNNFFLAKDGKTNPQKELSKTLESFFQPVTKEPNNHPQCQFVARYKWLKQQLNFDSNKLKEIQCRLYEKWMHDIDPQSMTMIFPSYYLGQPASIFGHLFFRINSHKNQKHPLLDYTINFAAQTDPYNDGFMSYIFKGTFGGYQGKFAITPYYTMIIGYNDIESRDIWEYDLNLSELEVRRMLDHLWEFRFASLDYFFFKENCAYQLLSLLEAARPQLHLRDKFWLWTIPLDGIKTIISQDEEIVTRTKFRPSRRKQMENDIDRLSGGEVDIIKEAIATKKLLLSDKWQSLSKSRQQIILNILNHYCLLYRDKGFGELRDQVLLLTSKIPTESLQDSSVPTPVTPDRGHGSFMLAIGGGKSDVAGTFRSILIRPSLHDMLNIDDGYKAFSDIECLKLSLRYYNEYEKWYLQRLDIINITALTPSNQIEMKTSWHLNTGVYNQPVESDPFNAIRFITGSIGPSYLTLGGLLYSMVGFTISDGERVQSEDQFYGHIDFGYMASVSNKMKSRLLIQKKYDQQGNISGEIAVAFFPDINHELRGQVFTEDVRQKHHKSEYQISYRYFF